MAWQRGPVQTGKAYIGTAAKAKKRGDTACGRYLETSSQGIEKKNQSQEMQAV